MMTLGSDISKYFPVTQGNFKKLVGKELKDKFILF